MSETTKTAAERIAEIEERRQKRRDAADAQRDEQIASDLAAIDEIEEETGATLHTMALSTFVPGVPFKVAFRSPKPVEYKRYADQLGKAAQKESAVRREAVETLGKCCLAYPPDGELRKALLEAAPGTLVSVGLAAAKVAELEKAEEGKG